jgi:hypothetical protein
MEYVAVINLRRWSKPRWQARRTLLQREPRASLRVIALHWSSAPDNRLAHGDESSIRVAELGQRGVDIEPAVAA